MKTMYKIDMRAETVEEVGELPDEVLRYHPSQCATPSGALFVASGRTRNSLSTSINDCVLFNFQTKQITHYPFPTLTRIGSGAAAIGSNIYLIGGTSNTKKMSRLDLNSKQWNPCADLVCGVGYPIVCAVGKEIFVLTNTDVGNCSNYRRGDPIVLQCYDTDKNEWRVCASLPPQVTDTEGSSAVAVWSGIYIVGGEGKLCLSYNVPENAWSVHEKPSMKHTNGSAVHLNGEIVLCGGSSSDEIEVFDIHRNEWRASSLKLPKRLDFLLCLNE